MSSMMFEQRIASTQTQMDGIFDIASTAFSGWTRLVDLNFRTFKAALADTQSNASKLCDARDFASLVALQANLTQPAVDNMRSYYREAFEIVSGTQADVASAMLPMVRKERDQAERSVEGVLNEAVAARDASLSMWQSVAHSSEQAVDTAGGAVEAATTRLAEAAGQSMQDAPGLKVIAGPVPGMKRS